MNNFVIEEMIYGWKRNIKTILILILLSLIGIVCIGMAITLSMQTDAQVQKYKEIYEDVQYFSIKDNFLGDREVEITNPDGNKKLNTFLNLLNSSEYFDYYMMYKQSVNIADYSGKISNVYGYEYNTNLERRTRELESKDGVTRTCTSVKGFWIGDNVIDNFNLNLQLGEPFQDSDFILTAEEPISIILGADYASDYEVGETIYVHFVFAEREAKIIGILEEGSNVYYSGNYVNLDRFAIMPMFLNDDYNGQPIYNLPVIYFYTLKNSGVLGTKLSCEDTQKVITEYSELSGFVTSYYVVEYDPTTQKTFNFGIENVQFLLSILMVLIIGATLFLLTIYYLNKIIKNMRYYAILMMNGCSKKQIFLIIIWEIIIILLIAYVIGITIVIFVSPLPPMELLKAVFLLLISTMAFGLIPAIASAMVFFRRDLVSYMQEEV